MKNEQVYSTLKGGKLLIKDSKQFLNMISGGNTDAYNKLMIYGKKQINQNYPDIPFEEQETIVGFAVAKTLNSFDQSAGTNILTYFTSKLRGEISDYRNKRQSMLNKIHKLANSGEENYLFNYDKEDGVSSIEKVELETPEDKLLEEEVYYRMIQAFRMAFSGIPLYSQYILNQLVTNNIKLSELADRENKTVQELSRIRNYALSLVFARVLRSNHLNDEEKEEIKKEHGLISTEEEELEKTLEEE